MTRDKRWLTEGGEGSWLARAVGRLERCCDPVLVSLSDPAEAARVEASGWRCVVDGPPAGRGPLPGLAAGLVLSSGRGALVLACDYPQADGALLDALAAPLGDADLRLPVGPDGRRHPLIAHWGATALPEIERALAVGRLAVRDVVARLRVETLVVAALLGTERARRTLTNVNTPAELGGLESGASGRER